MEPLKCLRAFMKRRNQMTRPKNWRRWQPITHPEIYCTWHDTKLVDELIASRDVGMGLGKEGGKEALVALQQIEKHCDCERRCHRKSWGATRTTHFAWPQTIRAITENDKRHICKLNWESGTAGWTTGNKLLDQALVILCEARECVLKIEIINVCKDL